MVPDLAIWAADAARIRIRTPPFPVPKPPRFTGLNELGQGLVSTGWKLAVDS